MGRLAWRNIGRNKGRTLIVVTAVAFSLGLMLTSYGLILDRRVKMMQAAVRTAGGNILVHGDGYWDARTGDLQIPVGDRVLEATRGLDGVTAVMPRVVVQGLLTSSHGGEGIELYGIDPDLEAAVYDYGRHLVDGTFLTGDGDTPIVLGSGLAEALEVELGDRTVLTATDHTGEVTRALFRVSGVIHAGSSMIDDSMAFTTLAAARDAMGMDAQLTQVGLLIDDDDARTSVKAALVAALGDDIEALEVLTWDEAIPDLVGLIEIDDRFSTIYALVIFFVVAFGIANTLLMMVMERVREFGMLNAIGMAPARISGLVLAETFMMTLVSVIIGVALGLVGHFSLVHWGIDFSELLGDTEVDMAGVSLNDVVIRSKLDPLRWATATLAVVVLIFASALYPAIRASRLDPVQAMRTYQ